MKFDPNSIDLIITPKFDGCSMRMYIYPDHVLCLDRNEQDVGVDLTNKC